MVLPLAKLGLLAFKQVSKPISRRFKIVAANSPLLRSAIVRSAQAVHRLDMNARYRFWRPHDSSKDGKSRIISVKPLSKERAFEFGTEVISEMIVYTIGAGTLLFEYQRSSVKEQAKTQSEKEVFNALVNRVEELETELREVTYVLQRTRNKIGLRKEQADVALITESNENDLPRLTVNPLGFISRGFSYLFGYGGKSKSTTNEDMAVNSSTNPPESGT